MGWRAKWAAAKVQAALIGGTAISLSVLNLPFVGGITRLTGAEDTAVATINSAILFVLGAMAWSQWEFRERFIQRIDIKEARAMQDDLPPTLEAEMKKADRVTLMGVSVMSLVEAFDSTFEQMVRNNREICVLLTHPDSEFVAVAATRDQSVRPDYQRQRILDSDAYFTELAKKGRVTIKKTTAPIDGEYIVLSKSEDIKKIYYKHYGYKTRLEAAIYFHLDENVDQCFTYFKSHVHNLWDKPS